MAVRMEHERFGVPDENLIAAKKWRDKKKKKYLFHTYVPTRKEVASLPLRELRSILIGWMCHSPTEIIPSRSQIEEVRRIIADRRDADQFTELLKMCANYVSYS